MWLGAFDVHDFAYPAQRVDNQCANAIAENVFRHEVRFDILHTQ